MHRLLPLCLLVLAGCASQAEITAAREAADDRQCVELGFEPGTEAYGNCRLKLLEIRAIELQGYAIERATLTAGAWPDYRWACE